MKKEDKDLLQNYFELQAIYLKEFRNSLITKKDFLRKIILLNVNTYTMLDLDTYNKIKD